MEEQESEAIVKALEADRLRAEDYLLHYDDKRKEYTAHKKMALEVLQSHSSGGHGSLPGKPTENAAIRSADYDNESDEYKWLFAVAVVQNMISERKKIFLDVRRRAESQANKINGKVSWIPWVYTEYGNIVAERYKNASNRSERTMQSWWRELIERVRLIYLKKKSAKNKNF